MQDQKQAERKINNRLFNQRIQYHRVMNRNQCKYDLKNGISPSLASVEPQKIATFCTEDGLQRVPLKLICDVVGVNWQTQKRKLRPDDYLTKRLGAEYHPLKGVEMSQKQGNPTHICIRLDRVEAFLNSINPENIRSMGNDESADWLESKHEEWDDALHAYETTGMAFKANHQKEDSANLKDYLAVSKEKRSTENLDDRKSMSGMMKELAEKLGNPYQADLIDE